MRSTRLSIRGSASCNHHDEKVVKVAPSAQPGQVIIYHAWENFQFARHKGQQEPIAGSWKALHLVGDYGHLRYRAFTSGPEHVPRGVPVEIAKCNGEC